MKKSFLLLFAGAFAMTAGAQQRQADNTPHIQRNANTAELQKKIVQRNRANSAAERTTSGPGGSRWYFYGDALNDWEVLYNSLAVTNFAEPLSPWADTNSYVNYATGKQYVSMVSNGTILAPQDTLFNDVNTQLGFGFIKITNSTAYTVDSIVLIGLYGHAYGLATANSVDTIRLTFTSGTYSASGSPTGGITGGGLAADPMSLYDGVMFPDLPYDSITNISQPSYTAPATYVQDIILDNTTGGNGIYSPNGTPTPQQIYSGNPAYWDTTNMSSPFGPDVLGNNGGTYSGTDGGVALKINTPLSVGAGGIVGVSLTFFSGKPSPPALTGAGVGGLELADVSGTNPYYYYNTFQPYIQFASDGGNPATAQDVPFNATYPAGLAHNPETGSNQNNNTGLFKKLPNSENGWTDLYLPNWAWYTPSGASEAASEIQYPFYVLHVNCPTCDTIKPAPVVVSHVGVNNVSNTNNTVNAYPNPSNGTLNIAFSLTQSSAVSVTLTNMVGEVVATQNMGTLATGKAVINTANLPEGMYIYTLTANGVRSSTGHIAIAH